MVFLKRCDYSLRFLTRLPGRPLWKKTMILVEDFLKNGEDYKIKMPSIMKTNNVQRRVCFVNVQSSLHENVVFSVCAHMCNAAYVIFIMWNAISGLDTCYHFRLNISCGVAVTVRSH